MPGNDRECARNKRMDEHDMSTQSQIDKSHKGNIPGPLRLYNEMTYLDWSERFSEKAMTGLRSEV